MTGIRHRTTTLYKSTEYAEVPSLSAIALATGPLQVYNSDVRYRYAFLWNPEKRLLAVRKFVGRISQTFKYGSVPDVRPRRVSVPR